METIESLMVAWSKALLVAEEAQREVEVARRDLNVAEIHAMRMEQKAGEARKAVLAALSCDVEQRVADLRAISEPTP